MSMPLEEKDLLQAVAAGDRAAFANLYGAYLGGLQRYTCLFVGATEEAEEIIQEAFVRIWERRDTLPQVVSFKAYLYQVTKNLVVDYWRQQKRRTAHQQQLPSCATASEPADADLIYQQEYQMAQQAIAQLTRKRKQIFLMRTQEDMSLDEIAQELALSKPLVKKQLYAATAFVKAYLRRHSGLLTGTAGLLAFVGLAGYGQELVERLLMIK